jgi:hypothetical protein
MLGRLGVIPMSASQRVSRGFQISLIVVAAATVLSGCSDTTVADHSACKAKAYEVFKVSPEKSAYDDVDVKFKQCVTAIKSEADLQACRDARNKALAVPDALDYVRVCMISAGYRETDICIKEAAAGGHPRSWIGDLASCFERSWWYGWGRMVAGG